MKNIAKKVLFMLAWALPFNAGAADKVYLHTGSPEAGWKLKPQAEVAGGVAALSEASYNDADWVDALVPGTAFSAYVAAGLEKDPNFGDNIHNVDKAKYDRSFWYRTKFRVPSDFTKERVWLNFNGVNRRAEIYLNGVKLGRLDGFMHRGRFDITDIARRDGYNVLLVLVHIPDKPLANQGSPTYLSSGGWDWMPYVPGLNSGITDKVFLSNTGHASLVDPWIRSSLPTRGRADLSVALDVENNSGDASEMLVRGTITPGNVVFEQKVKVDAHGKSTVKFDKRYYPQALYRPSSPMVAQRLRRAQHVQMQV